MDRFVEDEEGLGFACQYDRGLGSPLAAVITKRFRHERKLGLTHNLGHLSIEAGLIIIVRTQNIRDG